VKRALWFWLAALPLAGQPKLLVNAQTDTRPAAGALDRIFRELTTAPPQPAWIGYSVPTIPGYDPGCEFVRSGFEIAGTVHLEPASDAVILYRVESNAVTQIRSVSPHCEIDAGGLPVHWLAGVDPGQSVALLGSFLSARDRLGNSIVSAIGAHAGPAADELLDRLAAPNQPLSLRQSAVSLMGRRGPHSFNTLQKILASDPDERIQERAVLAIAHSKDADALNLLLSTARTAANSRLRAQAVSALGRQPALRPADTLATIAESDPDREVRRRAISTLRSLPDDQGIPALIRMAKSSRDPEVRKEALSSLTQSRDPRALALFEEILQ
jgi:hypothetical protein